MNLAILIFGQFEKSYRYSATPAVLAWSLEAERAACVTTNRRWRQPLYPNCIKAVKSYRKLGIDLTVLLSLTQFLALTFFPPTQCLLVRLSRSTRRYDLPVSLSCIYLLKENKQRLQIIDCLHIHLVFWNCACCTYRQVVWHRNAPSAGFGISRLSGYVIGKGKVHPCTGTEALYRPYGP
jgi:hypothetical protein